MLFTLLVLDGLRTGRRSRQITDHHSLHDALPIWFWGLNIASRSLRRPPEEIDRVAGVLARASTPATRSISSGGRRRLRLAMLRPQNQIGRASCREWWSVICLERRPVRKPSRTNSVNNIVT